HLGAVLVQAVEDRLRHGQFGRGGANDQRIKLFAGFNLPLGAEVRLHDVARLVEIRVPQVKSLNQQLLQPRAIGRVVGINRDRAPIKQLEDVFSLHEQDVQGSGRRDVIERERKFIDVFERFVKDDVEAELAREIDDDQLEARPFIEFNLLQE